ncbi:hypothetical protein HDV03_003680 [Kappamyces sp. JEL0829]|nr:hypothetical protein HDV03_003680 [Kappamyces sp. JEL0829]
MPDAYLEVNRFVRLTSDVQSQDGWLWSKSMLGYASWAVEFGFSVNHDGALSGDGFAFWVTPQKEVSGKGERPILGPVFGNQDFFNGLGIFFDTYANSRVRHSYPWIMAMVGDGKTHYDHDFDGNNVEMGGCHLEFRNKPFPSSARVTYLNGKLRLDLKTSDAAVWTQCFQFEVNLSAASYLGFTAMTGGVTSRHDITFVRLYSLKSDGTQYKASGSTTNNFDRSTSSHKSSSSSSGWGFFGYLFFFIFLAVFGYIGWVYYRTSQQNSYKRF